MMPRHIYVTMKYVCLLDVFFLQRSSIHISEGKPSGKPREREKKITFIYANKIEFFGRSKMNCKQSQNVCLFRLFHLNTMHLI